MAQWQSFRMALNPRVQRQIFFCAKRPTTGRVAWRAKLITRLRRFPNYRVYDACPCGRRWRAIDPEIDIRRPERRAPLTNLVANTWLGQARKRTERVGSGTPPPGIKPPGECVAGRLRRCHHHRLQRPSRTVECVGMPVLLVYPVDVIGVSLLSCAIRFSLSSLGSSEKIWYL